MNIEKEIKQIENKHKKTNVEYVQNEIKKLIDVYYISFINNDKEGLNKAIENINKFIHDFKSKYPSINHYVNAELLKYNNQLIKEILKNDLNLYNPEDVNLSDVENLYPLFDDNLMREILESEKDL